MVASGCDRIRTASLMRQEFMNCVYDFPVRFFIIAVSHVWLVWTRSANISRVTSGSA